jgi:glucose/arabinose dehydrogenase
MRIFFLLLFALAIGLNAAKKKPVLPPVQDPSDQLFRMAPMTKSSRSLVVNLSNGLHLAYDTQNMRTHSVWRGKGLDLYGPCYHGGKRPFICHPNGEPLWGNPPATPWMLDGDTSTRAHFTGFSTLNNRVSLLYDVTKGGEHAEVRQTVYSLNDAVVRSYSLARFKGEISHKAHIEKGIPIDLNIPNVAAIQREKDVLVCILEGKGRLQSKSEVIKYSEEQFTEEGSTAGNQFMKSESKMAQITFSTRNNNKPLQFDLTTFSAPDRAKAIRMIRNWKQSQSTSKSTAPQVRPANPKARRSFVLDPHYQIEALALPDINLFTTGMDWLSKDQLAICTYTGEVWIVENTTGPVNQMKFRRYARGMNEPMGLLVKDGKIHLGNKAELTRLSDTDNDGEADLFERVCSDWDYTGSYNSFSYGPVLDLKGNFVLANAGHAGHWGARHMGWALRIAPGNGKAMPFASGFREPNGIGTYGPYRDLFIADNQGAWIGACKLNHVKEDGFYGHPTSRPASQEDYSGRDSLDPPAIWFPYKWVRSASGMVEIKDNRFGPFRGQLLVGDFQNAVITRVQMEKVGGHWQGAVWPFLKGFQSGVNRMVMGADGALYVGGGKVKAWAANAPSFHSLERVSFNGKTPFEVSSVKALADGFELTFTKPVDKESAEAIDGFDVWQYKYKFHKSYGSPEFDHEGKKDSFTVIDVKRVSVSKDGLKVSLRLDGQKSGYVTAVRGLDIRSEAGAKLWHDTFYYTLNRIPK